MLKTNFSRQAEKFQERLPPKHRRQIATKIIELSNNPQPPDSIQLKGHPYRRADVGEYRIVYLALPAILEIRLIGKRNDSVIYKQLQRLR
ncbi:MAG: hypothetical protein WD014_01860 [Dongiaceae bacterium]